MAASCPSSSGIILYILIPPPNSAGTFWREPWTVFAASHSRSRRTVWVKSPRGVKEERGGPAMLGVKRESTREQAAPEGIPRAMGSPHGQCQASLCSSSITGHQPKTNPAAHHEPRGHRSRAAGRAPARLGVCVYLCPFDDV